MGDFRLALVVVDDDDGVLFLVALRGCCGLELFFFFLEVEAAANALAISAMVAVVFIGALGAADADADADVKAGRFAAGWPGVGAPSCNAAAVLVLIDAAAMSSVSLDRFLLLLLLLLLLEAILPPTLVRDPTDRVEVAGAASGAVMTAEASLPPPAAGDGDGVADVDAAEDRSSFTSSSRFLIRPSRKGWNV